MYPYKVNEIAMIVAMNVMVSVAADLVQSTCPHALHILSTVHSGH